MWRNRIGPGDLPEEIPVFPLPGALLLPRAPLPLHVFEPRYLAMVEDCLKTPQRLIGMVSTRGLPPGAEVPDDPALAQIGCAGRLVRFAETDDGRYMITLLGISRFRLEEEVTGFTPWRRFRANWSGFQRDLGAAEEDPGFDKPAFLDLLSRYLALRGLSADWKGLENAAPEMLINSISALLQLGPEDKQALLEAPDLTSRRETLVTLIEFALLAGGGSGEERLQ